MICVQLRKSSKKKKGVINVSVFFKVSTLALNSAKFACSYEVVKRHGAILSPQDDFNLQQQIISSNTRGLVNFPLSFLHYLLVATKPVHVHPRYYEHLQKKTWLKISEYQISKFSHLAEE